MKRLPIQADRLRVWRISQVARHCNVKPAQVWEWASNEDMDFPPAIIVTTSLVVWDEDEVRKWYRGFITTKARKLGLLPAA